jgi:hypothetical protein
MDYCASSETVSFQDKIQISDHPNIIQKKRFSHLGVNARAVLKGKGKVCRITGPEGPEGK